MLKEIPSAAAETVANIEDLLTQILLRLPARSVYRFQRVSKHWLSLISNPKFRQLRNPNKISALLPSRIQERYFNTIPLGNNGNQYPPPPPQIINPYEILDQSTVGPHASTCWILQSCNGLLLCIAYSGEPLYLCDESFSSTLCVLNPTTNQFSAFSYPKLKWERLGQVNFGLAFDPSKSPHYKVVCLHMAREFHHIIDIYSSETQAWRLVELSYIRPAKYGWLRHGAVYCNGALHWITDPKEHITWGYDIKEHDFMQYIDLDKEDRLECAVASPPLALSYTERYTCNPVVEYRYFGESGGHLYLIDIYKKCVTQFDVMEMGKDYSGWFVKYRVDLDPLAAIFPEKLRQFCSNPVVFLVAPEEKEEDPMQEDSSPQLLLHIPGISYSTKNKTFKKSSILTTENFSHAVKDFSPGFYMETLASV